MTVLDKLNKLVEIHENAQPINGLEQLIYYLKNNLRAAFGKNFIKVVFDKTENGNGILFIKFSKYPWKEATNDQLANSDLNFIISVEGFDSEGRFDNSSEFTIEMCKFHNPSKTAKKLKRKKYYNLEDTGNYIKKYFKVNEEAIGTGTASGATSSSVGGVERTEGNIAVRPVRIGGVQRRISKKKIKEY